MCAKLGVASRAGSTCGTEDADLMRRIAREEGHSRQAIARIVRSSEMAEYVERMKEEFRGLVPDALDALRHALQAQKDATSAFEILRNVGVAPRKGEAEPPQLRTPEQGFDRQIQMISAVLLEGHRSLGVDLPEGVEKQLAGMEESSNERKTAEKKKHANALPGHEGPTKRLGNS
jgi:hypothetical protein